jgi:putative addiction module component (TIGR02574 family)
MSDRYDDVLNAATGLPVEDRLRLIDDLWTANASPRLSEAWREEVARRSAAFDAGLVVPVPWEQVRAELVERFCREA